MNVVDICAYIITSQSMAFEIRRRWGPIARLRDSLDIHDFQARIEGIMRQLRVSSVYYSNRFMRSRCGVTNHAARQIRRPSHLLREPLARFWITAYIQFLRQIFSMTEVEEADVKMQR
jgi:hypothetical protein